MGLDGATGQPACTPGDGSSRCYPNRSTGPAQCDKSNRCCPTTRSSSVLPGGRCSGSRGDRSQPVTGQQANRSRRRVGPAGSAGQPRPNQFFQATGPAGHRADSPSGSTGPANSAAAVADTASAENAVATTKYTSGKIFASCPEFCIIP